MKVTIIILNWNRLKDTLECLESLKEMSLRDCRLSVLVVDNASSDNSVTEINKFLNSKSNNNNKKITWKLIKTDENLGFAGGNNFGISYSLEESPDYLILLNNDTLVDKNTLNGLLDAAKDDPDAAIISPKIYFAKGFEFHKNRYKKNELGKVIWYEGGIIDWNDIYGNNNGVDEVDNGQFNKTTDTDFATGACMLLNCVAIRKVGMFDEKYFMYFEDVDLSQRMKKHGWKVLFTSQAKLWHKVAQSSGVGSELNDYFITRNRLLFAFRYASIRTKFAIFRESLRLFIKGRKWQKKGVEDFYFSNFGKGSW